MTGRRGYGGAAWARATILGLVAAAVLVPPLSAQAQQGPIRLVPNATGQSGLITNPPSFETPPAPAAGQDGASQPGPGSGLGANAVPSVVQPRAVSVPGVESTGILNVGSGGFGPEIWAGSDRLTLAGLIAGLPVEPGSPALRDLVRRLLASAATLPGEGDGIAGQDLLRLRLDGLWRLGAVAETVALAEAAGFAGQDRVAEPLARARLSQGDLPAACGLAAPRAGDPAAFWRRLVVLCQAVSGDGDAAQLGLTILRESGEADPLLAWGVDTLGGLNAGPVPDLPDGSVSLVGLVALSLAGGAPDSAAMARLSPAEALLLVAAVDLDPAIRLLAAERAAGIGAVDPMVLEQAYLAYPLPGDVLTQPLGAAGSLEPMEARALLTQALRAETAPAVLAELVAALLTTTADPGLLATLGQMVEPVLDMLPIGPETNFLAPVAMRALTLADRLDSAWAWRAALPAGERLSQDPAAARLWGVQRIAFGPPGGVPSDRAAFLAAVLADADEAGPARLARLLGLRQALGDAPDTADWLEALARPGASLALRSSGDAANAAALGLSRAATDAGRRGEMALAALLALGARSPGAIPDAEAIALVEALMQAGFATDARRFALEAAMAAGL